MMKGISPLQIGIYVVFGAAIIFAMLIFSGKINIGQGSSNALKGSVTMWGTLPSDGMALVAESIPGYLQDVTMTYVQKSPATFQSDLVNALASGTGPDLVAVTSSDIVQNYPRLLTIPYTSLPIDTFKATFIDQGNQYLKSDGALAMPFVVNPIVMYYNRDLLTSAFVTVPPKTWSDVVDLNKKLTAQADGGSLSTETIAFGTYDNVTHAKDLIALLCQQGGNPLVAWDETLKRYVSNFGQSDSRGNSAVANALAFYTSFANPADKDHYSWNATLPKDYDQFISGRLGLYFGYASEVAGIRKKNPNLNFGVTIVPGSQNGGFRSTYGNMTGVAIVKMARNPALALAVAQALVSTPTIKTFLQTDAQYAPARKDMLADVSNDDLQTIINRSAIISKSFLDPDPVQTSALFKKFVDQINAGLANPAQILTPGDSLMQNILKNVQPQIVQ